MTASGTPPPGIILSCGWGRLLFAHTFAEPREVAHQLLEEKPGARDIAFYVTDPHIILNTAPQDLFMDPSHTYRIRFENYRPRTGSTTLPVEIRRLSEQDQIQEINRIYGAHGMVPTDPEEVWKNRDDSRLQYFLAISKKEGRVLAVALGVDHYLAFRDLENGSSLWSLAVDPQATIPGLGESLVRHLIEFYQAAGRTQLDLSVLHNNEEAINLYSKLGFERVPVFAIKRCNSINEKLFTNEDLVAGFNPYAAILITEAARRGISVEPIHPAKGYFRLTLGGRSVQCRESLSDLTSAVAMSRCDDKEMTWHVLRQAGLSLPEQQIAGKNEKADRAFLKKHGSVVVKPARGEQGAGVAVDLKNWKDTSAAIARASKICDTVLLEQFISGEDLRIIVINYELVAAAVRKPAEITGTGKHTIARLIESASRRRQAATGGESSIPMDEETIRALVEQGLDFESVPEPSQVIRVRNTANLHTGGTITDVTPELHPELAEAAVKAATALEIPVVGLDLIVTSPSQPTHYFIEANERPGLANHEPQPTAEKFIDLLFPQTGKHKAESVSIS